VTRHAEAQAPVALPVPRPPSIGFIVSQTIRRAAYEAGIREAARKAREAASQQDATGPHGRRVGATEESASHERGSDSGN